MHKQTVRLSIDVEPALRKKLKIAAATKGTSLREYCLQAIESCLKVEELSKKREESYTWTQLSGKAFSRDWNSSEDSVYDNLS